MIHYWQETIDHYIDFAQPKQINIEEKQFNEIVKGEYIVSASNIGKMIKLKLSNGYAIYISLGMGAEVLYQKNMESSNEGNHIIRGEDCVKI